MEVGLIRKIDIDSEMQQAYLDYAMSVIVARALPDARDGLKPVHRRILYAMHDMGLRPDSAYKKSARIVGEVLGKYHPHGDMAVYEAMARMAQDFSMRYLLVDGQGNFGSVDGDAPAAMRYTEARLAPMAADILRDIEKGTADFTANFDDTLSEPSVLPAAVPNLLVNGGSGIAVGMATSIPPHNLGEVVDALVYMIEHWGKLDDVTVETLMRFIHGPDFPTGGIIIRDPSDEEGLSAAYGTGRGKITVQAKAHVEDMGRGRSRVIVTELPYQTNKASLIERIADLVRDGTIEGIADLRDESDRQGMRIVIELAKTAEPEKILKDLYKRTPMQGTFSIIMLALVNGEPRLLSLKQALRVYLDHRQEVVRRRSEYDLARARERAHVLEGLLVALKHLDEVIKIIRNSKDSDEARARLTKRFKLSDVQAVAILDMPLKRLASLERQKIEVEYKEKKELIRYLEGLLGSPKKIREVIAEELREIKSRYGDRRRTQVISATDAQSAQSLLTAADLVASEDVWVTLTQNGLISRTPAKKQPKAAEAPIAVLAANTRDLLYLFTARGRGACVPVHSLPQKEDPAEGVPFASVSAFDSNAQVVAAVAVTAERAVPAAEGDGHAGDFVFLGTEKGMVKKIALPDLPGPSSQVFNVMNVAEGDVLGWARRTNGSDEVLLVTALGQAIRFKEAEVRPMGLSAQGVLGIKITRHDEKVVGMDVVKPRAEALIVADNGQGKRSPLTQFPTQGRYGVGVTAWKPSGKTRLVGAATGYAEDRLTVLTAKGGPKTMKFDAVPRRGRPARGGTVLKLKPGDRVLGIVPAQPQAEPAPEKAVKPKKAPKPAKTAKKAARANTNGGRKSKR